MSLRLPRVQYRSQEWWDHFGNCHRRVLESPGPYTKLYLLRDGCPSTYPGMDAIDVGSYTPDVTGRQLTEDFEVAELERIRKWRDAREAA